MGCFKAICLGAAIIFALPELASAGREETCLTLQSMVRLSAEMHDLEASGSGGLARGRPHRFFRDASHLRQKLQVGTWASGSLEPFAPALRAYAETLEHFGSAMTEGSLRTATMIAMAARTQETDKLLKELRRGMGCADVVLVQVESGAASNPTGQNSPATEDAQSSSVNGVGVTSRTTIQKSQGSQGSYGRNQTDRPPSVAQSPDAGTPQSDFSAVELLMVAMLLIVAAIGGARIHSAFRPKPIPVPEMRGEVRVPCYLPTTFQMRGERYDAEILDISPGGCRVKNYYLRRGDTITVNLLGVKVGGTIAWCGRHSAGLRFESEFSGEVFDRLRNALGEIEDQRSAKSSRATRGSKR